MVDLAALLEHKGDLPQAIDLLQRALRVDPYRLDALLGLGRLWAALGEADRSRPWFARALDIDPDCAAAQAGFDGLSEGLTDAYIRTLFDQYAPRFDSDLTDALAYRAPAHVAAMLSRHAPGETALSVLDLGCGTGLSGAALKPFAWRLDGIDLSPGMTARARVRGLYDSLEIAEARGFLERSDQLWDVIAAVDMLNYVGDLEPILAAAATRLAPGGLVVGTLERCAAGTVLTAKRRYAHGVDHLEAAAKSAGLEPLEIAEGPLRTEGGAPVAGLIFALRR